MKIYLLFPWLMALTAAGQIIPNPDFELVQDTNRLLPQAWQIDRNPSITITLDSVVAKRGRRALLIASVPDTARGWFTREALSKPTTRPAWASGGTPGRIVNTEAIPIPTNNSSCVKPPSSSRWV